ncbi:hypothetical protein LO763_19680 [Glycomyces sp. A-F 0318]|uniref:hypothetical protein n=1 Tax=Glycomyces amatae TaxID=2881355 RepID=UPI001E634645|nr:hypothetical protein [Glycomyces amatae]MCD0445833.1 hypothetical protein [Glycomyces amatae]
MECSLNPAELGPYCEPQDLLLELFRDLGLVGAPGWFALVIIALIQLATWIKAWTDAASATAAHTRTVLRAAHRVGVFLRSNRWTRSVAAVVMTLLILVAQWLALASAFAVGTWVSVIVDGIQGGARGAALETILSDRPAALLSPEHTRDLIQLDGITIGYVFIGLVVLSAGFRQDRGHRMWLLLPAGLPVIITLISSAVTTVGVGFICLLYVLPALFGADTLTVDSFRDALSTLQLASACTLISGAIGLAWWSATRTVALLQAIWAPPQQPLGTP